VGWEKINIQPRWLDPGLLCDSTHIVAKSSDADHLVETHKKRISKVANLEVFEQKKI
jgi:hypothetical protein